MAAMRRLYGRGPPDQKQYGATQCHGRWPGHGRLGNYMTFSLLLGGNGTYRTILKTRCITLNCEP
ncbi:hypothetical protein PR003_g12686 [Phytophthora rubi]|uniref:Uncharacterized protein n=1 Tax=Phytophthora rubi TaxID=129364 RepID=A0A6A4F8H8_9STRA|nr:hypothetical protein PR002_g11945 [Phytophthora rubi]KAE9336085.1 hypothetical protein PR003_g12686 [Phytophthora rubi]